MSLSDFQKHRLTFSQQRWGWRYLLFEIIFLPSILSAGNALLSLNLDAAALNFVYFAANAAAAVGIFRQLLLDTLRDVPRLIWKILGIALAGLALYYAAGIALAQAFTAVYPGFANVNDLSVGSLAAGNYPLTFLGTVLLVPVAEECFHRALVFRGLYDRSPALAWVLSVVLFAGIHVMNYIGYFDRTLLLLCFVQYVPAGLILAGAYRLSGSLLCPILIHAGVNCLGMLSLR